MLATESYRPSIISPAPGRYVNVGTDRCLCSCSSLLGARTRSSGRSSCALQPMSARRTAKKIADLTRIILPHSLFLCLDPLVTRHLKLVPSHLITLSALTSTFGGIVRPICFAALRLMMNSNFFGCSTGSSAGLAPFRILST